MKLFKNLSRLPSFLSSIRKVHLRIYIFTYANLSRLFKRIASRQLSLARSASLIFKRKIAYLVHASASFLSAAIACEKDYEYNNTFNMTFS